MDDIVVCEKVMHLIQDNPINTDIRHAQADAALQRLVNNIISVGVVALYEDDDVEAYEAGAKAMDKVLLRIANEAHKTAKEWKRKS